MGNLRGLNFVSKVEYLTLYAGWSPLPPPPHLYQQHAMFVIIPQCVTYLPSPDWLTISFEAYSDWTGDLQTWGKKSVWSSWHRMPAEAKCRTDRNPVGENDGYSSLVCSHYIDKSRKITGAWIQKDISWWLHTNGKSWITRVPLHIVSSMVLTKLQLTEGVTL